MKKLFLILALLGRVCFADVPPCFPATEGRWFDITASAADGCGSGNTMNAVGSITYGTSPAPPVGTYQVGPFTDANYLTVTAQTVANMLASRNSFTIQYYFYLNSFTNNHVVVSDANLDIFGFSNGTKKLRWFNGVGGEILGTTTIVINTWYHVTFGYDSVVNFRWIYLSSAATGWVDVLDQASNSGGALSASMTTLWVGRYQPSATFSCPCEVNDLRMSRNVVPPPYPTQDTRKSIIGASTVNGGSSVTGALTVKTGGVQ